MADDKARSRRALDALNLCNAGIQTGFGPFMSVFYSSERHWNPGQIGLLIACQSLAGVRRFGESSRFYASFLGLSAAAVTGGLLYQLSMPETRQ